MPDFVIERDMPEVDKLSAADRLASEKPSIITMTASGGGGGGGTTRELPVLGKASFLDADVGKTWKNDEATILSRFVAPASARAVVYGVDAWQARNRSHIDIQRPAAGEPPALRIKYPKRTPTFTGGGGAALVWLFGYSGSGAPTKTTGFQKVAMRWRIWVPADFSNYSVDSHGKGQGRPFKLGGMGGGPMSGAPPTGNPWTAGQSNSDDHGFSLRFQGTGTSWDPPTNNCLAKPYLAVIDPDIGVDRLQKSVSGSLNTKYGRYEPAFTATKLVKNAWNTMLITFEGNTWTSQDGKVAYYINGTEIFSRNNMMFRSYHAYGHCFFLSTFFGGVPERDPWMGSPQTQYLFITDIEFAASN